MRHALGLADGGIAVVMARCNEVSPSAESLAKSGVAFFVYQKGPCENTSSASSRRHLARIRALPVAGSPDGAVRTMPHNRGDECSAYLQYIVESYDGLPPVVAFLQYGAEHQLVPWGSHTVHCHTACTLH